MSHFTPPQLARLIEDFLNGKTSNTRRAYKQDIADFGIFRKADSAVFAVHDLLLLTAPKANLQVEAYKRNLAVARGLAPSTVQRRISALRELVKWANKHGAVTWTLQVDGRGTQDKRDARMRTRSGSLSGPTSEKISEMRAILSASSSLISIRDLAMFDLAVDVAGRRSEITGIDVADLNLKAGTISIVGKGRNTAEDLSLPKQTLRSLSRWLEVKPGGKRGPLFVRLDPGKKGATASRLTDTSFYRMIRKLGEKAGLKRLHPHSLRHSSITEAVEFSAANGISLDQVMQFSRHKSIATLLKYRDKRTNHQLNFARAVAERTRKA